MKLNLLTATLLCFLIAPSILAHPGVGIVMDKKGNVYYTDLKQVWKITPDGRKSIVVRSVHTHELYLDSRDNLYGEHLWYEGDATKKWGHRVWRLGSDGALTDIIPARQGFLDDYDDFHFVHDRDGTMYWVVRGDTTSLKKRSRDGKAVVYARETFRDVRWMTVTPDGIVYLIDLYDLVRVTPDGRSQVVVRNLADWSPTRVFGTDRHALMGIWVDSKNNVFVASNAGGCVKRVQPDGNVQVIFRSRSPWAPTGGFTAMNGDMWILEYGPETRARVHRIQKDGTSIVFD